MPRRTKCGGLSRACGPSAAAEASPGGGGGCVSSGFGQVNDFQAHGQGIEFVRAFVSSTHFLSFFFIFQSM
jgi:hypothetical protein